MIRKPNKQLSKLYLLLVSSLLVPLIGFFVYAFQYQTGFFWFIALALALNILILLYYHRRLSRKKSSFRIEKEEYFEKANLLKADLEHERLMIDSFREKIVNYSQLRDLAEKLSMCLSLHDTSATLSQEVGRLFGDKDITIILYLFHSKTGELGISSSQKGQMRVNIKDKRGDMFDQWMVKTMQPLRVEDTKRDFRFDLEKMSSEEKRPIRSLISVPLLIGNKALGILRVDSPKASQFAMEDLRFLRTIGDLGAIAIENAQLYEKVEDLAIRDGLTGLYLKHFLMDRLSEEINRELKRSDELSFIMLDLDYFKQYNDNYGHTAGDIVLKTVARMLRKKFKTSGNIVARYGGEEFCVLLPGCSKEQALQYAEEFRQEVEAVEVVLRREKTQVTVSIGIASFPRDAQMKEELIQRADHALYKAKQKGRNQVCAA